MGIEDLRAQQLNLEKWDTIGKGLSTSFTESLKKIYPEVVERSGLKLLADTEGAYIYGTSDSCVIRGDRPLRLWARGLQAEVEVRATPCTIKETSGGFSHYVWESHDDVSLSREVTRRLPAIPVLVRHYSWSHRLWWENPSERRCLAIREKKGSRNRLRPLDGSRVHDMRVVVSCSA
jgi:hypothetical protein